MTTASIVGSMRTALSGLAAAQQALSVTSDNIANVNTEGYTRKVHQQSPIVVDGVGAGVRTEDARRIVDDLLNRERRRFEGELGRSSAVAEVVDQAQGRVFAPPGESDRGIAARTASLASALEAVANSPENTSLRDQAISAVQDMVQQITSDADTVQRIRRETDQQIKVVVDEINSEIAALEDLNSQFARSIPTAELLDERDRLLQSLSAKIDISTFVQDNNAVAVYTAGGQALLEYDAYVLTYQPAASVTDGSGFQAIELFDSRDIDPTTGQPFATAVGLELVSAGIRSTLTPELAADAIPDVDQLVTTDITQGRLKGLLEARDTYLPELADQVSELSTMLRFTLNAAHNDAVPFPLPNTLTGSNTDLSGFDAAAGGGTATGEAYLAVVDTDGTVVADITLDMSLAANSGALAASLNAALGAFGTAVINADGALEIDLGTNLAGDDYGLAISEGDSSIRFNDSTGRSFDYGFSHYFGLNDIVVPTGSSPTEIAVRSDLLADSSGLSRVVLDHSTGAAVVGGAGDTRGLQRLAGAIETGFATIDRGGLAGRNDTTIEGYVSDLVGHHAGRAAQSERAAASDQALVDELTLRQGAISGVNLDEELSKLIVYQQAYTVAARVITITNELFGELVNIAR